MDVKPDVGNHLSFTPTQYDRMIASAKSGIAIDPNAPIEIDLVGNRARAVRREDAERDGDENGEDHRVGHELERDGQALRDRGRHRRAAGGTRVDAGRDRRGRTRTASAQYCTRNGSSSPIWCRT